MLLIQEAPMITQAFEDGMACADTDIGLAPFVSMTIMLTIVRNCTRSRTIAMCSLCFSHDI